MASRFTKSLLFDEVSRPVVGNHHPVQGLSPLVGMKLHLPANCINGVDGFVWDRDKLVKLGK